PEVVAVSIERAKELCNTDLLDCKTVQRLEEIYVNFRFYFRAIESTPFLDDTTTKHVLVHHGRLTGIVDVDEVCFGDGLSTIALTQMSLLAHNQQTDYVRFWCEELHLTDEQ